MWLRVWVVAMSYRAGGTNFPGSILKIAGIPYPKTMNYTLVLILLCQICEEGIEGNIERFNHS